MGFNQIGTKGYLIGFANFVVGITSLSGYISPLPQSLGMRHKAENKAIRGKDGEITTLIGYGDYLECKFIFVPNGTAAITGSSGAQKSAGIPANLAGVTITGLPIIAAGPFSDAFNTDVVTNPWIYCADGGIDASLEEVWKGDMLLRRYLNITSVAALT